MSNVSAPPEFDFWEFVNCGVCHLDFIKESGELSTTPFWLTECGHVVCNSHLNADQSCAQCGSVGIQLLPLAREMELPMSRWFESAPLALDAVGYALRFQVNTMATLVQYYKRKYMQYRPLLDRLKEEHAETKRLRKLLEDLRQENQQLTLHLQARGGDPVQEIEHNKRRRLDEAGRYSGHRTSSPRSINSVSTPVGPDRLTLPPSHHQPAFNSRQSIRRYDSASTQHNLAQYAYAPPRSARGQSMAPPMLTHVQSGSTRRVQARESGTAQIADSVMPPPPPTEGQVPGSRTQMLPPPTPQLNKRSDARLLQRPSFLPPPSPQASSASGAQRFVPQLPSRTGTTSISALTTGGFLPVPHYKSQQQPQRFLPAVTGSSSGSLSTVPQALPRPPSMAMSSSQGQRTPFIPNASGGRP